MYIKAVTLHGFKSYKEPVTIELSPHCNVVVGRNGAGKSNFFAAIRFVLGDIFTNLRSDERQALLHEGAGLAVMSSYVELVFDNADNRFPIDKEEVVLRRSVGLKKDEYFLDKKHVSKTDVANLLESAGFSKSNPYYIVQQGKITSLALMKDAERLELLMEVAGCKVYDERRAESERIMKDTEMRRGKVIEVVDYIQDRLAELEEEKQELKEFQLLDRDKRALEFTIYEGDLKSSRAGLQKLEEEREKLAEELQDKYTRQTQLTEKSKEADAKIKSLSTEADDLQLKKSSLASDIHKAAKIRTRLEMDIDDARSRKESNVRQKELLSTQLTQVEADVASVEADLEKAAPMYEAQLAKEHELQEQIDDVERRTKALNNKQGRSSEFATKQERDDFLQQSIETLDETLKVQLNQQTKLESEVAAMQRKAGQAEGGIDKTAADLQRLQVEIEDCIKKHHELKTTRDDANNERKELWRASNQMEQEIQLTKEESSKHERTLNTAWGRDAQKGLQAIHNLIESKKIPAKGVFGPLIELFDVDDKFAMAVETTGGGSLSHVVVDTEATAARIVQELNKQQLGRVTFMPLDSIKPKPLGEAPGPSSDVIPLISRLKYDDKFDPAFRQVFGKTLIARDTQTAATYARTHNMNCVTLDGDQVNRRGAITGGHNEVQRSRIHAMKRVRQSLDKQQQLNDKLDQHKQQIQALEKRIADVLAEMQRSKSDVRVKRAAMEEARGQLEKDRRAQGFNSGDLEAKKVLLYKVRASVRKLSKDKEGMKDELGTELVSKLSPADQRELHKLVEKKTELYKLLPPCQDKRSELELQKQALMSRLSDDLKKRKTELLQQLSGLASPLVTLENQPDNDVSDDNLERLEADLQTAIQGEKKISAEQEAVQTRAQEVTKELTRLKREADKLRKDEADGDALAEVEQKMEALHSKRAALTATKETATKKIRDLGALPANAHKKYSETPNAELLKKLKRCNEKLSKYAHVNKKALDQYISFTEQKDELASRLQELDGAKKAIQKLIKVLDQRKDDAIQRTFKGVSQHFSEVFKQIVASGKATLVMVKKRSRDGESDEDDDDVDETGAAKRRKGASGADKRGKKSKAREADGSSSSVLAYGGVSIKVSFTGHGEVFHLNQLSGGQKSVVALAFIFAIQRLDPAPFYLFDEIDANLDAAHRTAVAGMIRNISSAGMTEREEADDDEGGTSPAQFIATTFRPEFVQVADQCFGVMLANKVSKVTAIDVEQAMTFITHEAKGSARQSSA